MCTIGATIDKETTIFKNCDLIDTTLFYEPKIKQGKCRYIAFSRKGNPGIYAGINEFGLGIVAADTYTKKKYTEEPTTAAYIFNGYEKTVASFKNVDVGLNFLKKYYSSKVCIPDMLLLADKKKAAVFEFIPEKEFGIKVWSKGVVLRTNQFLILKGGKDRNEDVESYVRYDAATKLLADKISIAEILKNHSRGLSKFSVCRHGNKGEFNTQASIIMYAGEKVNAQYVINDSPCHANYKTIELC